MLCLLTYVLYYPLGYMQSILITHVRQLRPREEMELPYRSAKIDYTGYML